MSEQAAVEAQLNQMERVEPETPPQETPPAEPELNLQDDAAVDAALEANAIQVPDGDKLVPSSDVGKVARHYRTELKDVRAKLEAATAGSARAQQLEQTVQQLQQQIQQLQPYVQAYQQVVQQPAQTPAKPDVSDEEADGYARLYDLYKADGSGQLDRDRGRKIVTDMRRIATEAANQAAEAKVAPIHQMSVKQLSRNNFQRAMVTALPNGSKASEAALKWVWDQIDPSVTATVDGAREAFLAAVGRTYATSTPEQLTALLSGPQKTSTQRGPNGQFLKQSAEPIPEAVPRETSGGKDVQGQSALSEQERKFLSATGMSEADYLKTASDRFGGKK